MSDVGKWESDEEVNVNLRCGLLKAQKLLNLFFIAK